MKRKNESDRAIGSKLQLKMRSDNKLEKFNSEFLKIYKL